jgi:hypothetical protein
LPGENFTTDEVVFSQHELSVLNEIATVVSSAAEIAEVYSAVSALVSEGLSANDCDTRMSFHA